ncbi:MAG: dTDP-4-dehydrorhamnose 3,5-epimerase [Bacteroidales bacterium]|jgi:dTDP-4-dehydrorhamnose 3,5-epimerase|nr:dTDP-4-dehydrorhamnose 3,5-epimerase [Bacteroidales bacterium]
MEVKETDIQGLKIIKPKIFEDSRGYFFESYNKKDLKKFLGDIEFVQDNQSLSEYGTIRGLHYQLAPYSQAKLVRVIQGKIYDVAVDIRENSPTYGQYFGIELSEQNKTQLFIPKGFAHGFSVLSSQAIVLYKTDGFYHKDSERGINYNDPELGIDWQIKPSASILSSKDKVLPPWKEAEKNFHF